MCEREFATGQVPYTRLETHGVPDLGIPAIRVDMTVEKKASFQPRDPSG